MSVSRRSFLRSAAVISAAFALKPSTLAFGNASTWSNSAVNSDPGIKYYSREMFEPFVGDTFRVRVGKQIVDLKLVALNDMKATSGVTKGNTARTNCFSLQFQTAKRLPTPATFHTLNHSKLGDFDLFMVQSRAGSKFSQTAVINHVV